MTEELCNAEATLASTACWCDLREGHAGLHVDTFAAVEWL